jgi:hypothetical protein
MWALAGLLGAALAAPAAAADAKADPADKLDVRLPGKATLEARVQVSEEKDGRVSYFAASLEIPGDKLGAKEFDEWTDVFVKSMSGRVTSQWGWPAGDRGPAGRLFHGQPTGMRDPTLYGLAYEYEGRGYFLMCLGWSRDLDSDKAKEFFRGVLERDGKAFDEIPADERRCPTGWLMNGPHPNLPGTPVAELEVQASRDDAGLSYVEAKIWPFAPPKGRPSFEPAKALNGFVAALAKALRGTVADTDLKLGDHPGQAFSGELPIGSANAARGGVGAHRPPYCDADDCAPALAVQGRVYALGDRLEVLMVCGEKEADVADAASAFFKSVRIAASEK